MSCVLIFALSPNVLLCEADRVKGRTDASLLLINGTTSFLLSTVFSVAVSVLQYVTSAFLGYF